MKFLALAVAVCLLCVGRVASAVAIPLAHDGKVHACGWHTGGELEPFDCSSL